MDFKPFDIEGRALLNTYLQGSASVGSEYSYYAFICWFDQVEYAEEGGALYLRAVVEDGEMYWPPLVKEGVSAEDALKRIPDATIYFANEDFVNETYGKYQLHCERKWAEYIYDAKDFIALEGKRYHAKRNHIKKFLKLYNSTVEQIKPEDKQAVLEFERKWLEDKDFDEKAKESALREMEIVDMWYDEGIKGNLIADIVRVDGEIVGVSIGEIMPSGNAVVMYEKGNIQFEGVYSYLANTFAKRNFSGCKYINRQEDMGLEGLRKSKLSYNPAFLNNRYVMTPLQCTKSPNKCCALTGYKVKRLTVEDYDTAMTFFESGREALEDKKHFLNYTEEELKSVLEKGFMLGVFDGDKLLSTCAVDTDKEYGKKLAEICHAEKPINHYEFSGIMTAPEGQRKGISNALCREVIEYAKENLSPCVLCAVVQFDNMRSINNLQKLGFEERGRAEYEEYDFRYLCKNV